MHMTDLDWQTLMNDWEEADILYLRGICDEKLSQIRAGVTKRRALIVRGKG
jgi:hypothetical protein